MNNVPLRQYIHDPRNTQGFIGSTRKPALRQIIAKTSKGAGFIYALGIAFACKTYLDHKSAESFHETRLFESSVESNDWRCYHVMRQYNAECSSLDP